MSAGTLTLTNNSAAVTGSGTAFNNELAAGDFIVVKAGGVTYTLPVKTIEGDTALTLARNYNGPDITAGAWTAMPRDTLNRISAQIAADTAYAIRQRVLEIDNWYQLLEVNGDVTIKMADGSSYTGPSWLKLVDVMKEMQIDVLIPIAEQIRADAQQVADDKPVILQAKDDAEAAAVAAASSESNAATSETNAAASKDTAAQKAEDAAESARQAAESNPLLALQKSLNLSDLADRAAAWLNVRPIGATPLAADAVNDYDAPTWRQVRNLIESGTTGPTMNGVMNYHIGEAVPWETRAYYPPNCLPRDGQLVNRADWPELWAWAQKTTPITDAAWLADVTKRGAYSTGNGTTTFRLPDWNGVQSGSIPGVFFRGGVGAADMIMALNAAPEIEGYFGQTVSYGSRIYESNVTSGAFVPIDILNTYYTLQSLTTQTVAGANFPGKFRFAASRSNAAYGRNSTGEVVPNKVSGVWLVRASGGFVAANTSWSVINADAVAPGNGTTVKGGAVRSAYKTGANEVAAAELQASLSTSSTGVKTVTAEVVVKDSTSGSTVSKTIKLGTLDGLTGGTISGPSVLVSPPNVTGNGGATDANNGYMIVDTNYGQEPTGAPLGGQFWARTKVNGVLRWQFGFYQETTVGVRASGVISMRNEQAGVSGNFRFDDGGNAFALNGSWINGGSSERIKENFEEINAPFSTMRKIRACTWRLKTKSDNGKFGIGVLAEGLYEDYPEAKITVGDLEMADGTVEKDVESVQAGDSGVLAAVHHASILQLMDIVKEAISTIAGVTADDSAKAALEALAERIPPSNPS